MHDKRIDVIEIAAFNPPPAPLPPHPNCDNTRVYVKILDFAFNYLTITIQDKYLIFSW